MTTGLFVGLIAVAAGILQGVTGMGGGLIQMMVLLVVSYKMRTI